MGTEFLMNRLSNCKNLYQGDTKKVLCVCSAGLLRSPTTAVVLSQEPYNYNTRAVGVTKEFALISVDEVVLEWADEIVCMDKIQKIQLRSMTDKPIICLDIPDDYQYRDPELIKLIKKEYNSKGGLNALE